jgi:glycosyltransferase involved in cell wall biosynthesis
MSLHLGLVARCLNTPHVRGMGRYLQELLIQSAHQPELRWTLFGDEPSQPLQIPAGVKAQEAVFNFRGDRFRLWEQMGLPRRASALGVDVLHCTEGSACWWQPVPTVITLHDTIAWTENDGRPFTRFYWDTLMPAALRKSAAVITISQHSQRDILARWPDLAPKLSVIPHGIGDEYLNPRLQPPAPAVQQGLQGSPYLVFLGGPAPRKRFDWALQVLRHAGDAQLQLVACGFAQASHAQVMQQVPPDLARRVHLAPFLSNLELLALYRGADAVLYPTLYEGFGFPAIEAQAAGVPAVFSPVSSLAELVGPLAFTPVVDELNSWVQAVVQARALGPRRAQLAAQAQQWAQGFSWAQSCTQHLAVYRRAAA